MAGAGAKRAERFGERAVTVKGVLPCVVGVRGIETQGLRGVWDTVVRAGVEVALLVGEAPGYGAPLLTRASTAAIKRGARAGDPNHAAVAVFGGNGGGVPPMAQGQGLDRSKVLAALEAARGVLASSLKEEGGMRGATEV